MRSEYLSQNLPLQLMLWDLSEYPEALTKIQNKTNYLLESEEKKKKRQFVRDRYFFFFFKPKLAKLRCNISGNKSTSKLFF